MNLTPFGRPRSLDEDGKEVVKAVAIAGLSALATKLAEKAVEHGVEWAKKRFAPPPRAEEKEPSK